MRHHREALGMQPLRGRHHLLDGRAVDMGDVDAGAGGQEGAEILDLLGGARAFAKPGEKILLRANLLVGDAPEKCVNTHPSVLRAVAEIFKSAGARVSFGDSPAVGTARAASRKIGIIPTGSTILLRMAAILVGATISTRGATRIRACRRWAITLLSWTTLKWLAPCTHCSPVPPERSGSHLS